MRIGANTALALACGLGLTACSQALLADATAPLLPCEPDAITIEDARVPFGGNAPARWWATCGDVTYFCSQLHKRVICTEDPRPPEDR